MKENDNTKKQNKPGEQSKSEIIDSNAHTVLNENNESEKCINGIVESKILQPGNSWDDYDLLEEIGRGGMGVVLKARQNSFEREVAVKKLLVQNATNEARNRFISEAVVTGCLEHPNIVPVHEILKNDNNDIFISMKLVSGISWKYLLQPETKKHKEQAEKFDTTDHLHILLNVMQAVEFAHSKNIIHCDLKPENIMVGNFGEVLLMDWGLAVDIQDDKDLKRKVIHKSQISKPMGTPKYIAPELAGGCGNDIGRWTDVYLLGGILYEILMKKPPHGGDTILEVITSSVMGKLPSFSENIPQEIQKICYKALARDKDKRYQTVATFQKDLKNFLKHKESIQITTKSQNILEECIHAQNNISKINKKDKPEYDYLYNDFNKVIFGFEQALELWQENKEAHLGRYKARLAYSKFALLNNDIAVAKSQVQELEKVAKSLDQEENLKQVKQQLEVKDYEKTSLQFVWKRLKFVIVFNFIYTIFSTWYDLKSANIDTLSLIGAIAIICIPYLNFFEKKHTKYLLFTNLAFFTLLIVFQYISEPFSYYHNFKIMSIFFIASFIPFFFLWRWRKFIINTVMVITSVGYIFSILMAFLVCTFIVYQGFSKVYNSFHEKKKNTISFSAPNKENKNSEETPSLHNKTGETKIENNDNNDQFSTDEKTTDENKSQLKENDSIDNRDKQEENLDDVMPGAEAILSAENILQLKEIGHNKRLQVDYTKIVTVHKCGECHRNEKEIWEKTPHSTTFDLSKKPKAKDIFAKLGEKGSIKRSDRCMSCHFTEEEDHGRAKATSGVSCESCHGAGKDWIWIHNDKNVPQRERRLDAISKGMNNPVDIYLIAQNCYKCHSVPDEELVNKGGHVASSENFELVGWTQGMERHNFVRTNNQENGKSSIDRLRVMFVVGIMLELEYSLRGLAKATQQGSYLQSMMKRTDISYKKLIAVDQKAGGIKEISELMALFKKLSLRPRDKQQLEMGANLITLKAQQFTKNNDGSKLSALDSILPSEDKYIWEPSSND